MRMKLLLKNLRKKSEVSRKVKDYKKEHDSLSSSESNVYYGFLSLLGPKSMRDYKDVVHQLSR